MELKKYLGAFEENEIIGYHFVHIIHFKQVLNA